MSQNQIVQQWINNREGLVKLSIEMENDFSNGDIIRRQGCMSILFALACVDDRNYFFFREDISSQIRETIKKIPPAEITRDIDSVKHVLQGYNADEYFWGKSYIFEHAPTQSRFPDVTEVIQAADPQFVIEKDGRIASKASTWGKNSIASEVEVETLPEYRRQGYGRQVVSAWAARQISLNRIAIFSHEFSNLASGKLARSLGVTCFASILLIYEKRG